MRQIEVELVALGVHEAVGRRRLLRPVTAGVGHLRVEQEGVEVVGEVVVVGDRGAVAAAGVQPTVEAGLRRRRPRPRPHRAEPQRQPGGGERLAAGRAQAGEVRALRQRPEPGEPLGDVALDRRAHPRRTPARAPARRGSTAGAAAPGGAGCTTTGPSAAPASDPSHARIRDGQGRAEEALDERRRAAGDGPAHGRARENWKTSR